MNENFLFCLPASINIARMACPEAMKAHLFLLYARILPREGQFHSFQGTSEPMTPAFSTDSADTSLPLTARSSDFSPHPPAPSTPSPPARRRSFLPSPRPAAASFHVYLQPGNRVILIIKTSPGIGLSLG